MGGRRRSGRHILCVRLVRDAPPRFLTRGHREAGEPSVPGARGAGRGTGEQFRSCRPASSGGSDSAADKTWVERPWPLGEQLRKGGS